MKVYIISLESYHDRKNFQHNQAIALDLDIEIVSAIDASSLSKSELQNAANSWSRPINAKDVACFLSHRKIWKLILKKGERALIIEDDVVFNQRIKEVLDNISLNASNNGEIYDLEYVPRNHLLAKAPKWKSKSSKIFATKIYQNKNGLGCYSLDHVAAAKLLDERIDFAMVDTYVWTRKWAKYLQIEPAPAIQMLYLDGDNIVEQSHKQYHIEFYMNQSKLLAKYISFRKLLISIEQFFSGYLFGDNRNIKCNIKSFDKKYDKSNLRIKK